MTRTETQSRKRPAPGTSPPSKNPDTRSSQPGNPAQMSNDDFLAWSEGKEIPPRSQSGIYDLEGFGDLETQLNTGESSLSASNQLIRRGQDQQLTADGRDPQLWSNTVPPPTWQDTDDFSELEHRALAAKKDAQSKKPPKQVQPFIQKLWSLLQDNGNTDLIRWTTDGDSFVVLDEERFASEQLPTYFKHDNYPSFVRQLNMYGFHKRVGLTDNSMRASKTKAKSPSEYENPFFKRDRPVLQWLITKPKQHPSKPKSKKTREDEEESDDNEGQQAPVARREEGTQRKPLDLVTLPRNQLVQFQDEISQLKRSQQHINQMIARFQHDNNQYIRRATQQHERHEQSINAILQFLATFYSQNQDSGNIANMFHGAIHNNQPQGNVQEMGDIEESMSPSDNNQLARVRRQPLLLQAPPAGSPRPSKTPESSSRPASGRPSSAVKETSQTPMSQTAPSPQIKENSQSPPNVPASTEQSSHETTSKRSQPPNNNDMLAVINDMNANTPGGAPDIDLNLALRNYENMNNGPLTPEQRDSMLSMLANTSGLSPQTSNALLATTGSNSGAPQNALSQWTSNKDHIDMLHRLQQEQDSKVQDLAGRIQPLSPSGSIPGFENAYTNGDVNFDNWVNSDLFNSDGNVGADGDGGGWSLDNNFNLNDGGDYFGSSGANAALPTNAIGANADTFDYLNADGNGTADLFGVGGDDAVDNDESAGRNETSALGDANDNESRVIGSVANSEDGRTPTANADADAAERGGRRKRRRV